jgi:hypothetical protein
MQPSNMPPRWWLPSLPRGVTTWYRDRHGHYVRGQLATPGHKRKWRKHTDAHPCSCCERLTTRRDRLARGFKDDFGRD